MTRPIPLLVAICCLAIAGCEGGWSLEEFAGRSLLLQVIDAKAPSFQAVLDYDADANGCGRIGGARVTQDGAVLKSAERGGFANAAEGPCPKPVWTMNLGDAATAYVTVKLEDGSLSAQAVMQNLFAKRSVLLKTPPSAKVGELVQFDFQPSTDSMEQAEVSFLADGAAEIDKVVWYDAFSGQAQWEKNTLKVAVPARQGAAVGKVRFEAQARVSVFACDNLASCRSDGLAVSGQYPFTVTPP